MHPSSNRWSSLPTKYRIFVDFCQEIIFIPILVNSGVCLCHGINQWRIHICGLVSFVFQFQLAKKHIFNLISSKAYHAGRTLFLATSVRPSTNFKKYISYFFFRSKCRKMLCLTNFKDWLSCSKKIVSHKMGQAKNQFQEMYFLFRLCIPIIQKHLT